MLYLGKDREAAEHALAFIECHATATLVPLSCACCKHGRA